MARRHSKIKITAAALEKFSRLGMTQDETAKCFDISQNYLSQIINDPETPHLKEAWDRGRASLAENLREAQIDKALSGDSSMLKWLGIQYLNQSDRREQHSSSDITVTHQLVAVWGKSSAELGAAPEPSPGLPSNIRDDPMPLIDAEAVELDESTP